LRSGFPARLEWDSDLPAIHTSAGELPWSVIGSQPFFHGGVCMLVLSRKIGEEIVIGDNVRVRVLSIQGNQVRLGFVAPREIAITREELLDRPSVVVEGENPTLP
jgi:carbon storage regulator